MKEFKQSPYKFIEECILIFTTLSFFTFFINYRMTESIERITLLEIAASLGAGLGISLIYGIFAGFIKPKTIRVEDGQIVVSGKKTVAYRFDDLKAFYTTSTFILRSIGTVKVKIETKHRCIMFYIQKKDEQAFLNSMPEIILPKTENALTFKNLNINLLYKVLSTTFYYLMFSVCIMPAALSLVITKSVDTVWKGAAIIYFLLILWQIILFSVRYFKYYKYTLRCTDGKIYISCGKLIKKSFYLSSENITAVYFTHSFISRLFNLYSIKLLTRGSGKGLIEINYFPFMMSKDKAIHILENLLPKEAVYSSLLKSDKKTVIPSVILWLLPVFFVGAISIIGSPFFLLLIIPIIIFILQTYKNSGKNVNAGYYILQKGFIKEMRIFIPLSKIERVDAVMTVTCRVLNMTYMEIYLSGYRAVVFGGYYYKSDFDNFVKNINELS